jgi:hypothetical protein
MRTDMLLHLSANALQIEPHPLQHIDGYALSKFDQSEQQVFSSHIVVFEPLDEIERFSRFKKIGITNGLKTEIFPITAQGRLKHPGVAAMTAKAK